MKIITKIIYGFFIAMLLGLTGLFLASLLPIPGNLEVKIVKSGSMTPAIPVGALVIVKPAASYAVGDVITFGEDTKRQIPTTHRVISVEGQGMSAVYHTRGDANEEADPNTTLHRDVIGKVLFSAPFAGYILDFAKQPLGFALLIGVPAGLIIIEELLAIAREMRLMLKRRRGKNKDDEDAPPAQSGNQEVFFARSRPTDDIFVPTALPVLTPARSVARDIRASGRERRAAFSLLLIFMVGAYTVSEAAGSTLSYFSDFETSIGNFFQAGEWVDPQSPFNIVLNEFLPNPDNSANGMDFGNDASNMPDGEWIEIYNKGSAAINVGGWYMTDASGGAGNTHAFINNSNTNTGDTILAAHGWLVVYLNKPSLNNTGDSIFLYTSTSTGNQLIDSYTYNDPSLFCELELTPGSTNSTSTTSGLPGTDCISNQVAPNKSYARIPDGTGAFVDPVPTPGTYNIAEEPAQEPVVFEISITSEGPAVISGEASGGSTPAPEPEASAGEPQQGPTLLEEPAEEPAQEDLPPADTTPGTPAEETEPAETPTQQAEETTEHQPAPEPVVESAPEPTPAPAPEPAPAE